MGGEGRKEEGLCYLAESVEGDFQLHFRACSDCFFRAQVEGDIIVWENPDNAKDLFNVMLWKYS